MRGVVGRPSGARIEPNREVTSGASSRERVSVRFPFDGSFHPSGV